MIDPEREPEAAAGRQLEAALYAAIADASPADRDFLILRALLGADRPSSAPASDRLVMVPEGGGAPISLRPVARPLRVPEREIAPPTRARLQSPLRRWRIIWFAPDGIPFRIDPGIAPTVPDRSLRLPPFSSDLPLDRM
jgi:hypothetical protein